MTTVFGLALPAGAGGAEDPGARALQQQQIQRQQQQDALQLRLQQQQRATQNPPQDARQKQAVEKLTIDQRQRQQELHYRQDIAPPTAQPSDDAGTRRAKEAMEREQAQRQGQELLQRSDAELKKK
jgi:hypothetical protein